MQVKTQKSTLISVQLDAAIKEYTFGKQAVLEGKTLLNLLFMSGGKNPQGLIALDSKSGFVTLNNTENKAIIDELPLQALQITNTFVLELTPSKIAWEKSKIVFSDNTGFDATKCVQFLAIYQD